MTSGTDTAPQVRSSRAESTQASGTVAADQAADEVGDRDGQAAERELPQARPKDRAGQWEQSLRALQSQARHALAAG